MAKDFQNPKVVANYDEHIRKLIPAYELVHQQIDAMLMTYFPNDAKILIVGCGTGYELQYLASRHANWHFTALDPSLEMLKQAQKPVQHLKNIEFIHGDTRNIDHKNYFDAALVILVGHFIAIDLKQDFYRDIYHSLNESGYLISYDLMQEKNAQELQVMQYLAQNTGLTSTQSQNMIARLAQDFALIPVEVFQNILKKEGFVQQQVFCQVFNYYGFLAQKSCSK